MLFGWLFSITSYLKSNILKTSQNAANKSATEVWKETMKHLPTLYFDSIFLLDEDSEKFSEKCSFVNVSKDSKCGKWNILSMI